MPDKNKNLSIIMSVVTIRFLSCVKFFLFPKLGSLLFVLILFVLCTNCSRHQDASKVKVTKLKKFKTLVGAKDSTLAVPVIIKYDHFSHSLFVYDKKKRTVSELDDNGHVVHSFGRVGKGPGEFLSVDNIFLAKNNLYILDSRQYHILKYQMNGGFISTMDYGKVMSFGNTHYPPPPFASSAVRAVNIENMPVVTLSGNVLLSSIRFKDSVQTVYELRNWSGEYLANIGKVPKDSRLIIDQKKLRNDVKKEYCPRLLQEPCISCDRSFNIRRLFLSLYSFS